MTLPRNDRVKIWSAGVFPSGVTPEPLTDQQQPVQRNPPVPTRSVGRLHCTRESRHESGDRDVPGR